LGETCFIFSIHPVVSDIRPYQDKILNITAYHTLDVVQFPNNALRLIVINADVVIKSIFMQAGFLLID